MEKIFVVQRVAAKLWSTEKAIDAAMVEAAELLTGMIQARTDMKVSAMAGADAQAKLVEAIAALGAARSAMIDMHGELAETKLRLGVRTKLIGVEDKPDEPPKKPKGYLADVG